MRRDEKHRVINTDLAPIYSSAIPDSKKERTLRNRCRHRPVQYLNNILEQDHRAIKRRVNADFDFAMYGNGHICCLGDVALIDLQREFQLARSKPRHLAPEPKTSSPSLRPGLEGLIDSLLATQHLMVMFRRSLSNDKARIRLHRLSNRPSKILAEIHQLQTD